MPDQDNQQTQTAQISGTVQIQPQGGQQTQEAKKPEETPVEEKPKSGRRFIVIAIVLLLALGAGFFYWRSTFTEDTDDAQVDGDIYQVSSRIAGQVTKVYVQENKPVNQGDLLLEIDPKDFQVALEQAQANLANAQAAYTQANVNVPITTTTTSTTTVNAGTDVRASQAAVDMAQKQAAAAASRVDEAKANAIKATKDVERYKPLVEKDVISKQQYDAAVAAADSANASVIEAEQNLVAQQAAISQAQEKLQQARNQAAQASKTGPEQVEVQRARAAAAQAQIKQAQAQVDQAMLNLSYTRVVAPVSGIVDRKNVDVGANLSVGQALLNIVPLDNLWVTANFKETQLKEMCAGEDVDLKVDALGGRKFTGHITQIGGATGSRLSLFPPENATGNYVKVVQRIPVRIDFNDLNKENGDHLLRPGYSVTPDVTIKGDANDKKCRKQ